MKKIFLFLFIPLLFISSARADGKRELKIHFLYGSKPAKGCKTTEGKAFGGIKGGHVSLEMDDEVIGFVPVKGVHIFPINRRKNSRFTLESAMQWKSDTISQQYTTVLIPLTEEQYQQLKSIHQAYLKEPPYDYAFFGMRCASATNELLAQIGITRQTSTLRNVLSTFYPQRLRRRLLRQADKNNWPIHRQVGRSSRKWEKE